jgi:hypothetical protein
METWVEAFAAKKWESMRPIECPKLRSDANYGAVSEYDRVLPPW